MLMRGFTGRWMIGQSGGEIIVACYCDSVPAAAETPRPQRPGRKSLGRSDILSLGFSSLAILANVIADLVAVAQ